MTYIQIKRIAFIAIMACVLLFSIVVKADDSGVITFPVSDPAPIEHSGGLEGADSTTPTTQSARDAQEALISSLIFAVHAGVVLIGLGTLLSGLYNLKLIADEPRKSKKGPLIFIFVGVFMLSASQTINTALHTIRGDSTEMCLLTESQLVDKFASNSGCWDTASSEISGALKDRLMDTDSDAKAKFLENLKTFLLLCQGIGYVYFFIGLNGIKKFADGNSRESWTKPLAVIVFSALIIDLPHTATVFITTLQKLGVSI